MNRRQELCRNFQRGSCKYGAQCRFVHASSPQQQQARPNPFGFGTGSRQPQQEQAKPNPFGFGTGSRQPQQEQPKSNPFGFGTGSRQQQQPSFGAQFQQQQKPNPFGFGVQDAATQSRNAPGPGAAKPFQNKWVRDSSAPAKQSEAAPPQQAAHTSCADPESCRQQVVEDFKNEAPLWKLTCYTHLKSGPCDIKGDISFEELRAKAYDQGRQGHPLRAIVEEERNLQNAKLMEFTNFLNNPRISQSPSFRATASFPEVKNSSSFGVSQSNGPPVFNSFSQIGSSTNFEPGSRTTPGVSTDSRFGQMSHPAFPAPTFGVSEMKLRDSGPFGSLRSVQSSGNSQGSSMSSVNNFPKSPAGSQHRDIDRQSQDLLNGIMAPTSAINQAPVEDNKNENQDDSIWLKEKWSIGEIPLSEPPQRHINRVF